MDKWDIQSASYESICFIPLGGVISKDGDETISEKSQRNEPAQIISKYWRDI